MTFYMIRDKATGLWYTRRPPHSGGWTTQDKAAVWTTKGGARSMIDRIRMKSSGKLGYRVHSDCEPEVVTLPTVPSPGKVTFVDGDDWEGVYIDGKLVAEGHHVRIDELLQLLGINGEQIYADDAWLADRGSLPQNLSEVKRG